MAFVRVAILLAVSCLGVTRLAASAGPLGAPIVVDDCQVRNTRSYVAAFQPVALSFRNLRAVPAVVVRFTIEYGGRAERITDRGRFSQNVRIDHRFAGFYNARYGAPAPRCSVDSVEFSDGSVWAAQSKSEAPPPT